MLWPRTTETFLEFGDQAGSSSICWFELFGEHPSVSEQSCKVHDRFRKSSQETLWIIFICFLDYEVFSSYKNALRTLTVPKRSRTSMRWSKRWNLSALMPLFKTCTKEAPNIRYKLPHINQMLWRLPSEVIARQELVGDGHILNVNIG